ncbi:lactate 2-monooxygenase [Halosegnis rubeus]|jgi:isopentenyl-diphosphate delta-isomerase|uniref:Alpha-hydroxy-acid oxidizing protein n=1 Tax=Halosegnis rubeus TaxID=2212850 RepID=A0A5N5UMG3_9EURY|nr:lactate 2-monooxygenase [Halosegnis rubeus]KAB7516764.1 alpha-hydroxy-acid oxidizing protein [Halosegnis rubeus]KAB7520110.1 alpha-hydroxy-acid oxidizing protein [Halosegnis rubeus]
MSDDDTHGEQFGVKQIREVYRRGMFDGETPDFPVSFETLREEATERMSWQAQAYIHGGAGTEETFERNKEFSRWRIVPRMLRGVADRDLSVDVLGEEHAYPLMITPLGVQGLVHEEGELATARAAADLDVPFVLSSLSTRSMEEVADALGDTPKWFQYYWSADRDVAASFLDRAEEAGYEAIVLTVDAPTLGWRERLLSKGYYPFLDGEGMGNYFSDPAFRESLDEPPEEDPEAAVDRFLSVFGDASLTWDDLEFVFERTDLPVIIKGILHPEDARKAVEAGAAGVQVSTHGGRQIDGSISAIEALPEIVEEVGDETTVLFDSGIRRGEHAFKALALGADSVMLGRPFVYGLAHSGQDGVEQVLRNTLSQLDLTMGLAGIDAASDIDSEAVRDEKTL